jgi:hypothetical protein
MDGPIAEQMLFPQILFIEFDVMQAQQFLVLILERLFLVMFFLILDISPNRIRNRLAHRECSVSALPSESRFVRATDPSRRDCLCLTQKIRNRDYRFDSHEHMQMVWHSVDLDRGALMISDDAAHLFIEIRFPGF